MYHLEVKDPIWEYLQLCGSPLIIPQFRDRKICSPKLGQQSPSEIQIFNVFSRLLTQDKYQHLMHFFLCGQLGELLQGCGDTEHILMQPWTFSTFIICKGEKI